jgi:hypothetical protein
MMIAARCVKCSTLLEHPLQEFYFDLQGALEVARKRGSVRIPLMCAKCTQTFYDKERIDADRI